MGTIERGTILTAEYGRYTVMSLDRPGVVTMPLGAAGTETYQTGDKVVLVSFPDGDGLVLGKID